MQILIPDSWLREHLDTNATPKQIQEALSLCGPSVERLHKAGQDYIYDIEVTTNRVDMMSVVGIAHECLAILPRFGYMASLKQDPSNNKGKLTTTKNVDYLKVKIDKDLCFRFSAALIKGVKVEPSPDWMQKRLELAGINSINNVVDISNYLMLEMGQPVHTFDYDKISNAQMILRESRKGEKITTLDNQKHVLPGGDIVIEDGSEKIIDLCGIMGGLNSAIDKDTKNVLLFVQVYEPNHIRQTSMKLAHRTPAAVLFEKGLPTENVLPTLECGIDLFSKLTVGKANEVLDILNVSEELKILKLKIPLTEFTNKRLGINLKFTEITRILQTLGFIVKAETEVAVPWSRRFDINIAEDLAEEIARIYGYHNLPSNLMSGALSTFRNDKVFDWERKIKYWLSSWGFTETYTYSLVADQTSLKLKNPLSSEWEYLRSELASSHRKVIQENAGKVEEINLFEIANVYFPQKNKLPIEELHLIISSSNTVPFRLKGIVEGLEHKLGTKIAYDNNFGNEGFCFVEINLAKTLQTATTIKKYIPISKYPPIIEDANVMLTGRYEDLIAKIEKVSPLIKRIDLIDKYDNKLTLRITYHSDAKQLSATDIAPLRAKITII